MPSTLSTSSARPEAAAPAGPPSQALCQTYAEHGFWKLAPRIFPENVASLALHERVGFHVVETYRRYARLDGTWRDCAIIETLLGEVAIEG